MLPVQDYTLQDPSVFREEEEQEPEASLPTPKKTPKAPFSFSRPSRPSAPFEHITNDSYNYDSGIAESPDDVTLLRKPPRVSSSRSSGPDRTLLFDSDRRSISTDRSRETKAVEDHFEDVAPHANTDRGATRGVKRSEAPNLQLFGGGREAKRSKEKVVSFFTHAR